MYVRIRLLYGIIVASSALCASLENKNNDYLSLIQEKNNILQKIESDFAQLSSDPLLMRIPSHLQRDIKQFINDLEQQTKQIINAITLDSTSMQKNLSYLENLLGYVKHTIITIQDKKQLRSEEFTAWASKQGHSQLDKKIIIDALKGNSLQDFYEVMQLQAYDIQGQAYLDLYQILQKFMQVTEQD